MPASTYPDLLVRLKEHLNQRTFPEEQAEVWIPEGIRHPLLMLKLPVEVAGFAVANGKPEETFAQCYSDFKQIYASNHDDWDRLNVSFVLCLEKREPELENLFSSIETDTYFCRKFVVSFEQSIDSGLEILPFIPLERSEGAFQRPPSARTLLQRQLGVPAKLAEYLVELGHSEDRIVRDCLNGDFGEPRLDISPAALSARDSITSLLPVRLKGLEIRNFRAYRKPKSFDLDADLIVLYGPNGFGKTSFFDALDFGVTGEIGRLEASKNDSRFRKAAVNLEGATEPSLVTLIFQNGNAAQKLTRAVESRQKPHLDSKPISNKKAIAELTGIQKPTGGEHLRNLISLFRATHLFSQENQELVSDFQSTSALSSDVVSRMLAFEDYSSGTKKVADVIASLENLITNRSSDSDIIRTALSEESSRLTTLEAHISQAQTAQALQILFSDIQEKLKMTGLAIEYHEPNLDIAVGWRALVEASIEDTQGRIERLRAIAPVLPNIAILTNEIATKQKELEVAQTKQATTEKEHADLEEEAKGANKRVAELANRNDILRIELESLTWVGNQKKSYSELTSEKQVLNESIAAAQLERTVAEQLANEIQLRRTELESRIAGNKALVQSSQDRLAVLKDLRVGYADWQQNNSRLEGLEKAAEQSSQAIKSLRSDLDAARKALREGQLRQEGLEREVEQIEKNQTELQNLLSTIETLVENSRCPLCGFDHGTVDRLRHEIELQRRTSKYATQTHAALRNAQIEVATATANVNGIEQKIKDNERTNAANVREVQTLRADSRSFANKVGAAGLSMSLLTAEIGNEMERLQQLIVQSNEVLGNDAQTLEVVIGEERKTAGEQKQIRQQIASKNNRLDEIEKNLNDLLDEAKRRNVSLDLSDADIQETTLTIRGEQDEIKTSLEQARHRLGNITSSVASKQQELQAIRDQVLELEVGITRSRHQLMSQRSQLRESNVESSVTTKELDEMIETQLDRLVKLEETKQAVLNLEVALDAAETSARQLELKESIRLKEITLAQVAEETRKDDDWLKYFTTVMRALEQEKETAVGRYTDQYGSRASVIQKRLRTVYGFGDISLKAVKGRIQVRVTRNEEALRPPDYFSESQQQILLLSIFLTACTTQTWSSFAPILMDDPVTHFDDLNTYSFLDLLIGLLEGNECPRQFIFSTCEEKLFQLARQKFQHLGDRTRFYSFKSIGIDGPVVEVH